MTSLRCTNEIGGFYKINNIVKQHLREFFPYKMPLREEKVLEKKSKNQKKSNQKKIKVYLVMFNVILKYRKLSDKL